VLISWDYISGVCEDSAQSGHQNAPDISESRISMKDIIYQIQFPKFVFDAGCVTTNDSLLCNYIALFG